MAGNEGERVSLATTENQAPKGRIPTARDPDKQGQLGGASLDTALDAVYTPRRRMWRYSRAHEQTGYARAQHSSGRRGIANSSLVAGNPSCMPVSWLRWW